MKRVALIWLIPIIMLSTNSCVNPTAVATALELSAAVVSLIDAFSRLSENFSSEVSVSIASTRTSLSEVDDLFDAAKDWEDQWNACKDSCLELHDILDELIGAANEYFEELDENNSMIKNAKDRELDAQKTQVLRQDWDEQILVANRSLENADLMIAKGEDYTIILRNEAMRRKIVQSKSKLEMISLKADEIAGDLTRFSKRARHIFRNDELQD